MQTNTDNCKGSAVSQACAACKHQRRRCSPSCILAPYFPASRQNDFLNAHKLFGISNIKKNISDLDPPRRAIAMKTIIYQANMRASDPVGGCHRYIVELTRQIDCVTAELELVNQRLAICKAQAAAAAAAASEDQVGNEEEVNPIQGLDGLNNVYDDSTMRVHEKQCQEAEEGNVVDQGNVYDASASSLSQVYNVFDTNSVKVESDLEACIVPLFHKRDLSDIGEDIKPLLAVFDDKGAGTLPFDSKGPVRLCSDKLKEVSGSIQHELKHDLKDAASLFTLTNGKG